MHCWHSNLRWNSAKTDQRHLNRTKPELSTFALFCTRPTKNHHLLSMIPAGQADVQRQESGTSVRQLHTTANQKPQHGPTRHLVMRTGGYDSLFFFFQVTTRNVTITEEWKETVQIIGSAVFSFTKQSADGSALSHSHVLQGNPAGSRSGSPGLLDSKTPTTANCVVQTLIICLYMIRKRERERERLKTWGLDEKIGPSERWRTFTSNSQRRSLSKNYSFEESPLSCSMNQWSRVSTYMWWISGRPGFLLWRPFL